MARDKDADPRLHAREILIDPDAHDGDFEEAHVWALIHQGDALHRIAKAIEAFHPEDEVARRRHEKLLDMPPELST